MLLDFTALARFDLLSAPWQMSIIGVAFAALVLMLGRALLGTKKQSGSPGPLSQPFDGSEYDPFIHGSKMEKRVALRRRGNLVEVLVVEGETGEKPWSAWVLDRSTGGLGILVERTIPEGTILNIRPRHAPSTAPWVKVEVKTCRAAEGQFLLHCCFLDTPPWSVLLLFG
jgi:hypothetical protein